MTDATQHPRRRLSFMALAPLAGFLLLGGVFAIRLATPHSAAFIPSVLVGKPMPSFQLPPLDGMKDIPGFSDADLKVGKPTVINVFSSTCYNCRVEQPELMALARQGVRIYGLLYKDKPEDARRFLGANGNPFSAIGDDANGRISIDFGVYGVPETFIIDGQGRISQKIIGEVTAQGILQGLAKLETAAPAKGAFATP